MRRALVAGNWKMNGTRAGIAALLDGIKRGLSADLETEIAVCPPFVYLSDVLAALESSTVAVGAQNVSEHEGGAFTGEIAPAMLADLGCRFAIVGHSERRALFAEDDATVARKFVAAQAAGLVPILCVGELLEEREQGVTEAVVGRQLDAVLELAGPQALDSAVIAYEPVWAIGTGRTATPAQAQEVHAAIRAQLAKSDASAAQATRILYGGSVKPGNAGELFAQPDIDGGLIGGASLAAADFAAICAAAG